MSAEALFEIENAEVVNLTSYMPRASASPKAAYAASACAALAFGFGAVAAGMLGVRRQRSEYAAANACAASVCAVFAVLLHLAARRGRTVLARVQAELPDRNYESPLDYTIIIPIYNRPAHVRALLNALGSLYSGWSCLGAGEVLVIDDGSSDETPAVARDLAAGMPLPTRVLSKENGGVSSARNAGFAAARGRIGVVLDSDCMPEAQWLPAMLGSVRADRRLLAFARIRAGRRPVYPLESLPDRKGFVGASYAMERTAYLKLGGCYERYGASHDDRDLVLTALANGYRVAHAKDAWIEHPLRRETLRSMWRAGLNSKYGNLFAARHGAHAAEATRPTPYYFFGIGSHYGSSILAVVALFNLALAAAFIAREPAAALPRVRRLAMTLTGASAAYAGGLGALGLRVGARKRELPAYVATLAAFQLATFLGRLRGTFEYGVFLL